MQKKYSAASCCDFIFGFVRIFIEMHRQLTVETARRPDGHLISEHLYLYENAIILEP